MAAKKNNPMSVRLPEPKRERLETWIAAQPAPPSTSTVIITALDEFLDRNGAPPERSPKAKK